MEETKETLEVTKNFLKENVKAFTDKFFIVDDTVTPNTKTLVVSITPTEKLQKFVGFEDVEDDPLDDFEYYTSFSLSVEDGKLELSCGDNFDSKFYELVGDEVENIKDTLENLVI